MYTAHHLPAEKVSFSRCGALAGCFLCGTGQCSRLCSVAPSAARCHYASWFSTPRLWPPLACRKRAASKSTNGSHKYKGNSKDLKPPDLWIHHERLELKPMDKSPEPNPVMTDTPIPRTSQDITPIDATMDNPIHQRRNSYRGESDVPVHLLVLLPVASGSVLTEFSFQSLLLKCIRGPSLISFTSLLSV